MQSEDFSNFHLSKRTWPICKNAEAKNGSCEAKYSVLLATKLKYASKFCLANFLYEFNGGDNKNNYRVLFLELMLFGGRRRSILNF